MSASTVSIGENEIISPPLKQSRAPENFSQYLIAAVWFGLFAGLLDGAELLLFQRINWEQWGRILHVSTGVLWIAPLVEVLAFATISLFLVAIASLLRMNTLQVITWILTFFTVYDSLSATGRIAFIARFVMAIGAATSFDRWLKLHQSQALRFWTWSCRWLLTLWLLVFLAVQGGTWVLERYQMASLPQPLSGTPNIVLIVVDTLRGDHLSAYGYGRPTTPNLDRIAKQGVLFENAISASSWTFPSHASLLTGKYPSEHGMQDLSSMRLGSAGLRHYTTLGDALQQKGYRTGAFSANGYFFTSNVGLGKGFIHFEDQFYSPEDMFVRTSFGCMGLMYASDCGFSFKAGREVNAEALTWLGEGERPFFAFLNYFGVHEANKRNWTNVQPVWGKSNQVDRYDSALSITDAQIGALFQQLQSNGLSNNTLLLITADHGESLGDHHLHGHASSLYLEQIHVPLIMWYPGHVPAGVRVSAPVSNVAVAATIMSIITGNSAPFAGSGLASLWANRSTDLPYPVSELAKNVFRVDVDASAPTTGVPTALNGNMKSIITPQWHLIEHSTLGMQLYDWVNDPGELNNVIDTPQGAVIAHDLELQMQTDKSP